jgi:hypothetical protein
LFLAFVIGPIDLIWGGQGKNVVPNFTAWWAHLVSVADPTEIHTATGIVTGVSLIAAIYFIWTFFLILLGAAEGLGAANRP